MNITNKMSVSKAELERLFPGCDSSIFFRDPTSDVEFMERFLPNKLWRMNNLYTIVNKFGERVPFVMNRSQLRVYSASLEHPRLLILKSRQQGISTFWLLCFLDDGMFIDDLSIGLMAQGKDEAGTLLTRAKLGWNTFNGDIKKFLSLSINKDNSDEIGLTNGSTIFIRTSFRSATLQRLHISEYGKICNKFPERAKETKTGTLQAIAPGNPTIIESTAEGINDFKRMWDATEGRDPKSLGPKEFYGIFLSWLDDPDCVSDTDRIPTLDQQKYFADLEAQLKRKISRQQRNFWIDQYQELGEATFQEYPATPEEAFKAIRDGSFYDALYKRKVLARNRRLPKLYDENLPVEVFMDLGMNDDFVMGYVQIFGKEVRLINEYVNSGEGLEHYVNHMNAQSYPIARVYGPHDIEVRELSTGKSRKARLRELGVRNVVTLPRMPVQTGIELVRAMLDNFWIDSQCTYIHDCFQNYSKEWDAKLEVWKDKPLHNEWSHGADMVRMIALSRSAGLTKQKQERLKNRANAAVGIAGGIAF